MQQKVPERKKKNVVRGKKRMGEGRMGEEGNRKDGGFLTTKILWGKGTKGGKGKTGGGGDEEASPVELLLQALIGVVDAQLLKAVVVEAFEAIDVQYGKGCVRAGPAVRKGLVDSGHQPAKESRVEGLCQSVPRVSRRLSPQHCADCLSSCATSPDFI